MYGWLVPRVVFPAYERLSGRRLWSEVRRLRLLQWRSPEELAARAGDRLRPLLAHAARHVPHYRTLFERAGLRAEDVPDVSALSRVPVTTRGALRAGFPDRVVAENLPVGRRRRGTTGGSSGQPLEFYRDAAGADAWLGAYLFFLEWAGAHVWNPRVYIASPAHYYAQEPRPSAGMRVLRRTLLGERTLRLSGTDVTLDELRAGLETLPRGRRYVVWGYPSALARLVAALRQADAALPAYPQAVITFAETLTEANASAIREALRCPVSDQYSCHEVLHMAQSCPEASGFFHVNTEHAVIRVVDDDGRDSAPGVRGRVLVTDLTNYVMPFINYELGDMAAPGPACSCGRGFPTLAGLEGRLGQVLRTPRGTVMSAAALSQLMVAIPGTLPCVVEYQAEQTAPDGVVLRVVPTPRFTAVFAEDLRDRLERALGHDVTVTVMAVERIPLEPSGKRYIIKSVLPCETHAP